jgi:MFS family permease
MGPGRRGAYLSLATVFVINTLNFYDRQVLGALAEPIRADWKLKDLDLGLLTTAFTLLYAAAGVPIGRLADLYPRKLVLSAGVFAWSVLTAACGAAGGYWQLFALRLGVGVGEASCAPAATSLVGDLFPAERRGRALSIFMAGLPAGIALSYLVSGRVAAAHGWRAAFLVAGLPGMAVALVSLFLVEPPRGATEARLAGAGNPERMSILAILSAPAMVWIIASGVFHNFNLYALSAFLMPLLQRYHGLGLKDAADLSTLISGAGGAVGLFAGGILADRAARRWRGGRLLLSATCVAASVPLLFVALSRPQGDATTFVVLLGAATAFLYVYYSGVYATIQDLIPPERRGTAMAVYFFAMYTLGGALGPTVTGALSDFFTRRAASRAGADLESGVAPYAAEGLREAMLIVPVVGILLALVLFAGARAVPSSEKRR